MRVVDAGVDGLNRRVDGIAFLVSPNDVIAHAQGNDLLVVKNVLDDDDGTVLAFGELLVGVFFFLTIMKFGNAHADGELLSALRTGENQALAFCVLGFVECDVIVTLGASDSFHLLLSNKKPSLWWEGCGMYSGLFHF